jgi:hypothetical protein
MWQGREDDMLRRILWSLGGFCAAAAGLLVLGPKRTPKVEGLAENREDVLGDHNAAA